MKLRRAVTKRWVLAFVVIGFLAWKLRTSHFDWVGFWRSVRTADWRLILAAVVAVYSGNVLRAMRWAVFLRPSGIKTHWWSLVGPQFVGFTGLAIFGRIGELIRPLLVARRTGLTFASQVAVVTVERVFDLGAFALIFSANLLLSPSLGSLPHHEYFRRVGVAIALLTVVLVFFVVMVRVAGGAVARALGQVVGRVSERAGVGMAEKVLAFRDGLDVIVGWREFLAVTGLSVAVWAGIALAYVLAMRAFPEPVHGLSVAEALVLMGFSVVGGIVQLPGVGGGAQVGTISALTLLFGIPAELAVGAGMVIWLTTSVSVVPMGLMFAKVEGVNLRGVLPDGPAARGAVPS